MKLFPVCANNIDGAPVCSSRLNRRRNCSGIDAERELPMKMMMIRRYATRIGAVALCSAALCAAPMLAQGGGGGGRGMQMTPQAQVDALDKAVTLTADQKPKVLAIYTADAKKRADLMSSQDPDMRTKMTAMRTDENTQIKALLTDDQKTKFDAMPQRGGRGGGGGGGGAMPPPQ
jgi:periplasmic protein CpxP/Spy